MNRTKWVAGVCVAVLALGMMVSADAAERSRRRGGERGEARGGGPDIERIARRLQLDTATAARLGAALERQKEGRQDAARDLREEMADLREMLRDEATPEGDIDDQLEKLRGLRREMQENQTRASEEIRGILGPRKSAEFLMMMLRGRR